jgi:hypothetical protein
VKGGWGTTTDQPYDGNALAAGAGVRAGVSIYGAYVGAVGFEWLGRGRGEDAQQFGGEVGYGLHLLDDLLTLRPQIGAGLLLVEGGGRVAYGYSLPGSVAGALAPSGAILYGGTAVYVEPGVTALVSLGKWYFAGADVNLFVLPGAASAYDGSHATPVGITLHAQLGVKF